MFQLRVKIYNTLTTVSENFKRRSKLSNKWYVPIFWFWLQWRSWPSLIQWIKSSSCNIHMALYSQTLVCEIVCTVKGFTGTDLILIYKITSDFYSKINSFCKKNTFEQWRRYNLSSIIKIKQYLPLETRQLYYNAYILPVLDYCLTVWGSTSKYQLDRLLKLQKRAARIILDMPPDAPSMPLFQQLGWLTIYERLEYNKAIVLYKSTNGLTPSYISDLFEFPSSERYNVRSVSNNDMLIKRHNTKIFEKSLQYGGPRLWNSLPTNIRNAQSLQSFKNALLKFIKSKRSAQST